MPGVCPRRFHIICQISHACGRVDSCGTLVLSAFLEFFTTESFLSGLWVRCFREVRILGNLLALDGLWLGGKYRESNEQSMVKFIGLQRIQSYSNREKWSLFVRNVGGFSKASWTPARSGSKRAVTHAYLVMALRLKPTMTERDTQALATPHSRTDYLG